MSDDKIHVFEAKVKVRGDRVLEVQQGANVGVIAIIWVSWLAGVAACAYAIVTGERWAATFGMFMYVIGSSTNARAWRSTATSMAHALHAAMDPNLRPVRMRNKA